MSMWEITSEAKTIKALDVKIRIFKKKIKTKKISKLKLVSQLPM